MGTTAQFQAVGNSSPRRTVAKLLCDLTEIGQARLQGGFLQYSGMACSLTSVTYRWPWGHSEMPNPIS